MIFNPCCSHGSGENDFIIMQPELQHAAAEAGDGLQLSAHHRGGGTCCSRCLFLILPFVDAFRLSSLLLIHAATPAALLPPQHSSGLSLTKAALDKISRIK